MSSCQQILLNICGKLLKKHLFPVFISSMSLSHKFLVSTITLPKADEAIVIFMATHSLFTFSRNYTCPASLLKTFPAGH